MRKMISCLLATVLLTLPLGTVSLGAMSLGAVSLGAMAEGSPYLLTKGGKPSRGGTLPTATPRVAEAPQERPQSGGQPMTFTVTDIAEGGMVVGRCTAPEGYTLTSKATCSVTGQSAGNPWLLRVMAQSPDKIVNLSYFSARDYVDDGSGQSGVFSYQYYTPLKPYMTAAQFCDDHLYSMLGAPKTVELLEDDAYPDLQALTRQRADALLATYRSLLTGTGVTADKAELSLARRRYRVVTDSGLEYIYCVAAATQGVWFTAALPGPYVDIRNSYVLWEAPYVYAMLCPAHLWQERGAAFDTFVQNTSASDQFIAANRKLSDQLWDIITGRGTGEADRYSEEVMRQETASGDDYDDERFTDYIFDQNDYTLSSGDHVKVSTAYDYVFEGADGNVYYSNSLSDQPGGSTQLYPNR